MSLKVLSAGAVKRGVAQIAKQYQAGSGETVSVEFDTAPSLSERLKTGECADVVVLPPAILDELAGAGLADNARRGYIGRSRVGVFVRRGEPLPDVSSVSDLKQAVFACAAVIYNTASSGLYIERMLEKFGLYESVAARIVKVNSGAAVMERVAAHAGAIGFGQLSEIRVQLDKGVAIAFAGPLPDEVQNTTPYDAAATSDAPHAGAFVTALTSEAARTLFAATGID